MLMEVDPDNEHRDVLPPSPYERFRYLRENSYLRRKSFVENNWPPDAPVSIDDLVNDGFCFMGIEDKVQCSHCGGVLSNWMQGDNVREEHSRHFPTCPLVRDRRNAALSQAHINQLVPQPMPEDAVYSRSNPGLSSVTHTTETGEQFNLTYRRSDYPSNSYKPGTTHPKYPEYAIESKRIGSFKGWPTQMQQKPDVLVKAGFFYMGQGDKVKCFFCGGVLWDWEPCDEVWTEHAKWFPLCPWLKLTKGEQFIQKVQKKLQAENVHGADNSQLNQGQATNSEPQSRSERGNVVMAPSDESVTSGLGPVAQSASQQPSAHNNSIETRVKTLDEYTNSKALVAGSPSKHNDGAASAQQNQPGTDEIAEIRTIMEENLNLKEQKLCKICLDNEVSILFVPCGHLTCCPGCSVAVETCPMCRAPIEQRIKAYWQV